MPLLLTDVDDCLLDFSNRFQAYVEALGMPTQGRLRDIWRIEQLLGINVDAVLALLERFNADESIRYEPEPCARQVLPALHRAGYRFVAISACGTDPGYHARRLAHLEATFGFPFEALHTVPLGVAKDEVLARYPSAIWVEDNLTHARDGARAGHRTFLLDRGHNATPDPADLIRGLDDHERHGRVTRVADWHAIHAILQPQKPADLIASARSQRIDLNVFDAHDEQGRQILQLQWIGNEFGRAWAGYDMLRQICAYADAKRLPVVGRAMDDDPVLIRLYRSLGWVVCGDTDDEGRLMRREPR